MLCLKPYYIYILSKKQTLLTLIIALVTLTAWAQTDLKIGITPGSISPSAVLEAASTSKGFLIPRMTTAQMNAISSPANGLQIYNTTDSCTYIYRNSLWMSTCSPTYAMAWGLSGNSNTVDGTNFIGTTNNIPFNIKVNNQKAGRIDNTNANAFFGYLSGNVTTGNNNAAFGDQTLAANTTGFANSAFGSGALLSNTTGFVNSAFGREALTFNTTGKQNSAFGVGALKANISGDNNNAFGYQALVANTTGAYNNSFGYQNLVTNTTGSYNTSYGHTALYSSTTASYNTAVGAIAMFSNTTGSNNTAVGNEVLRNNTTAWSNSALGYRTLFNNTTGNANTAIGDSALVLNTTGANNIGIGYQAGSSITTGSNNTFIGYSADATTAALSNATAIGYNAKVAASNSLILGGTGANAVNVGMGITTPLTKLDVVSSALTTTPTMNVTSTTAGINENIGTNYRTFAGAYFGYIGTAPSGSGGGQGPAIIAGADKSITFYTGASVASPGNAWDPTSLENVPRMTILQFTGNTGIGTMTPQYKLDVDARTGSAGNPLRLLGLNAGATSDSIISSNSGILRRLSINQILSNAWTITGNSGTVDGTNFIGTTDNVPLSIRVNNQKAGRIGIVGETYMGYQAGNAVTNGQNNTLLGYQAGASTTNAWGNTAVGYRSLYANVVGGKNVAIGDSSLTNNTTEGNVAVGYRSQNGTTTGGYNTSIGLQSLLNNTSGGLNVAIGADAMLGNTTGGGNVAVGNTSLRTNTTGNNNTALGYAALGTNNSSNNTALGYTTLYSNTTGTENVAIGNLAMYSNTTGNYNIGIGSTAIYFTTTGNNNNAIGYQALNQNTTGSNNTALGHQALPGNTTAWGNTALGYQAAFTNSTGQANVAIGDSSLYANTTGTGNTTLGYQSGLTNITGSNTTLLGYRANVSTIALTNATAIGANAVVGASNSMVLGGTGANAVNVGINTTTPQYKLDIDAQTGSAGNPLRLLGLNAGATSDSIISSNSGILRRLSINQILGNAWNITGNTGTTAGTNFIGTTDAQDLVFKTNSTEGMRLNTSSNVGIGTSAPVSRLNVVGGDITVGRSSAVATVFPDSSRKVIFKGDNTNNTDDVKLYSYYSAADATQFRINIGDNGSIPNDALEVGSLSFITQNWSPWTTTTATGLGIGTTSPSYKLDIDANTGSSGNPVRLLGLQAGATSDSIISSNSGVLRRLSINQILSNAWTITGNAGTVDGTNFIGTTDNIPLSIRVNNQKAGRIDNTNNNAFWGHLAGNSISTGLRNTAIGSSALTALTTSTDNTAVGYNALSSYTTSSGGNTAIGSGALQTTSTGAFNTAVGFSASNLNTTGAYNTAIGYAALQLNTTGGSNSALGYKALIANTTGAANTALGESSLYTNTTGNYNTAIGASALNLNLSGNDNVGIGGAALLNNSTGSSNTAIGRISLNNTTSGYQNTAIGYQSLYNNTTGYNNVGIGYQAGSSMTTGTNNIAIGYAAQVPTATASNQLSIGNWIYGVGGLIGINTSTPQYKLDIDGMTASAGNPLRLQGLNIGANTDSMLTSLNGVVRQIAITSIVPRLVNNFWSLTGNSGTSAASNFIGTTDANDFVTKTNNTEVMRATSGGNVGIATTTPSSTLQVNGSFSTALVTKTAAYTATSADHIIIGNATTAAFTVTLPTAVGIAGRQYIIKKIDSSANAVTVATTSAQTIDGAATVTISIQWQTKTFVSDGTNWLIISNQ